MIVDIIHHSVRKNSKLSKCEKAHIYAPDNIPFDIEDCQTLANFAILVLVPYPPNQTVAVPYDSYKQDKAFESYKFTGSFAFSSSKDFSLQITHDFYRPVPIMDKEK